MRLFHCPVRLKASQPQVQPPAKPPIPPPPVRPVPPPAKPAVQPVAAAQPVRPSPARAEPAKPAEQKKPLAEADIEPAKPLDLSVPGFRFGAEEAPESKGRGRLLAIVIVILVGIAGLYFLFRPGQPSRRPAPPAPAAESAAQSPSLELTVEPAGLASLVIHWDSSTPAFAGATGGSLSIADGGNKSSVPLSSAELKLGAYKYKPHSNNLAIRLDVNGATAAQDAFGTKTILGALHMLAPASH